MIIVSILYAFHFSMRDSSAQSSIACPLTIDATRQKLLRLAWPRTRTRTFWYGCMCSLPKHAVSTDPSSCACKRTETGGCMHGSYGAERPAVAPLLCWGGIRQRALDTTAVERAELQRKYACRRQRSTAKLTSADPSGVGWNGEMD